MPDREPGAPSEIGPDDPTPIEMLPTIVDEDPVRCRCLGWARAEPVDLTESAVHRHHSRCVMHPLFDPTTAFLDQHDLDAIAQRAARRRDIEQQGQRCSACAAHLVWSDVGGYWRCVEPSCTHYCKPPG